MPAIGPNFTNELAAAGLCGLPLGWNADGDINYGAGITPEQETAIKAVLAAHDHTKQDPRASFAKAAKDGLQIASTGTPGLNATYDAAGLQWQAMKDEALYIATFGAFSAGVPELVWAAKSGVVTFATTDQFKAVVRAIGDWLTGWQRFVAGQIEAAPAGSVTIA